MKHMYTFLSSSLVMAALAGTPLLAQSTSGQAPQPTPQSGQTTGRGDSTRDQKQRPNEKVSSQGERVGQDTPSAGTDTDQRGTTAAKGGTSGALNALDRTFLTDALEGNRAEIALAELAQKKATTQAVRDLATSIRQDHEQANDKLKAIADKIGAASNATDLKPEHKQLQDRLSRLEDRSFDAAYASEMVKDHQKDIATYQKAASQLKHAELKAYATETLPHLKAHLEKARGAQTASNSANAH